MIPDVPQELCKIHPDVNDHRQMCWLTIDELHRSKLPIAGTPHGAGVPPFRLCFSLVHLLPHLLLFITFSLFPFLIHFTYFLLLSIRSLSTRIVPLRFQA